MSASFCLSRQNPEDRRHLCVFQKFFSLFTCGCLYLVPAAAAPPGLLVPGSRRAGRRCGAPWRGTRTPLSPSSRCSAAPPAGRAAWPVRSPPRSACPYARHEWSADSQVTGKGSRQQSRAFRKSRKRILYLLNGFLTITITLTTLNFSWIPGRLLHEVMI